jgi:hypothetical protein
MVASATAADTVGVHPGFTGLRDKTFLLEGLYSEKRPGKCENILSNPPRFNGFKE